MGNGAAANKKATTALGRIDDLELQIQKLYESIAVTFSKVDAQFRFIHEQILAIRTHCGDTAIDALVLKERTDAEAARIESASKSLKNALEIGTAVSTDVIKEKSLLVAKETNAAGEPAGYLDGTVYVLTSELEDEAKLKAIGQGPGLALDTPSGGKLTVNEVYDLIAKVPAKTTDEATV